jgi:divalent metal cation (Fe/Co/Zn/Cd) transporter
MTGHGHAHPAHHHSHGHAFIDDSIKRSRQGLRAVALALLVLSLTAAAQALVFVASGSVALLADLIHNAGDAATAIPPTAHSWTLSRDFAAKRRMTAPHSSPTATTRADAYVSLAVVASAATIALGLEVVDPIIGLAITLVILRITWHSWQTVSGR